MISDLPSNVVATRFLPVLVHRLTHFADVNELEDSQALVKTEAYPSCWLVGLA